MPFLSEEPPSVLDLPQCHSDLVIFRFRVTPVPRSLLLGIPSRDTQNTLKCIKYHRGSDIIHTSTLKAFIRQIVNHFTWSAQITLTRTFSQLLYLSREELQKRRGFSSDLLGVTSYSVQPHKIHSGSFCSTF